MNFREPLTGEVRRIPLPRRWVNKGRNLESNDSCQLRTPYASGGVHAPRTRRQDTRTVGFYTSPRTKSSRVPEPSSLLMSPQPPTGRWSTKRYGTVPR